MSEAAVHANKSAAAIIKEKMNTISGKDYNLPNPTNLTRAINRLRQERRLKEPIDLNKRYLIKAKICHSCSCYYLNLFTKVDVRV